MDRRQDHAVEKVGARRTVPIPQPLQVKVHNGGMDFVLTDHADKEARRRQIPLEWIESTMARPEQISSGTNNRKIFQSRVVADGKTYLVRLVVEDWHQPPVVVTVYRTSKIEKYWGPA
jgi:hypothetical protein